MRLLLAACLLLVTLTWGVYGQQACSVPSDASCFYSDVATRTPNQADPNTYFVIGGLFDVHKIGSNAFQCSTEFTEKGIINVLAFFWAIQEYYAQYMNGRSVTVGAVAFDTCMRTDQTIENVLSYAQCKIHIQGMAKENLVAYVGPYRNEDARRTGMLARDLKITLLSPTANAMDLTFADQTSLLKMAPSFMYDLKGIVAFLDQVRAGFVLIVYSGSDMFWKAAYEELKMMLENKSGLSVCVQYGKDYDEDMAGVVKDLAGRIKAKYIVPLMSKEKLNTLMEAISNDPDIPGGSFRFILTSEIGRDIGMLTTHGITANNTIVVDQVVVNLNQLNRFANFIQAVRNDSTAGNMAYTTNPWLSSYLAVNQLPDMSNLKNVPSPIYLSAARTIKSVEGVIKGMDAVMQDCGQQSGANYQFCDKYRNLQGKSDDIYSKIKTALGIHMTGSGDLMHSEVKYSYFHFFIRNTNTDVPEFVELGSITLDLQSGSVQSISIPDLTDTSRYGYLFSEPTCPGNTNEECCLPPTTVAPSTTPTTRNPSGGTGTTEEAEIKYVMVEYPVNQAITGAYADTPRADSEYGTRFDLGHKWIIALGVLAGLGILCVLIFEIYILYKLLGTRMGSNWRTMWLGQLLLFGLFLCYLVLFAYLPIPTKATCGITRFGVGVAYAFCFAVLLVKLMVILTSKTSDVLLPGDVESPNYLKGIYQFLMFVFAVGVQIVIDVQWLITVPPEAVSVTANNGEKVWICNHYTWEAGKEMDVMSAFVRTNFENHLMSLIYIMVMIFITTVLSLNAHGIITNHRESVFIGIAAGFSIPIWLAWGLLGGLNKDHEYAHEFGDACIAFGLFLTATLILFAMFLPKVRQLVNMGVEGIYLEDDRETYYAGSVIMAPPSYKSKGPGSVIYVNNQGIYSEPVVIGNGDPSHPSSTYSAPVAYQQRKPESQFGGSTRVLKVTDDLRGRHPQKRPQSEIAYSASGRPRSTKGTLPRSRSQTNLGAL